MLSVEQGMNDGSLLRNRTNVVELTRSAGRITGGPREGAEMATVTDFGIDFSTIGPAVGERFPEVVLPDQSGQTVSLHQVRGGRRALVVFHRSAAW